MTDDVIRALRARERYVGEMGRVAGGMGTGATDRLTDLDACARDIRTWSLSLVPGLLQTDAYAAHTINAMTPSLSGYELVARAKRRAARRDVFLADWSGLVTPRTGRSWFVMGEAAITQPRLNLEGHITQLELLLQITKDYPRVIVEILPNGVPAAGDAGQFSLHHLADGGRVGHLESLVGGWYTTEPNDITRMYSAFFDMSTKALAPSATQDFIAKEITACRERLRDGTTVPSSASPPTATLTPVSTSRAPRPGA